MDLNIDRTYKELRNISGTKDGEEIPYSAAREFIENCILAQVIANEAELRQVEALCFYLIMYSSPPFQKAADALEKVADNSGKAVPFTLLEKIEYIRYANSCGGIMEFAEGKDPEIAAQGMAEFFKGQDDAIKEWDITKSPPPHLKGMFPEGKTFREALFAETPKPASHHYTREDLKNDEPEATQGHIYLF